MTEPGAEPGPTDLDKGEMSLLALGSRLLRWRRAIITMGVCGGLIGLAAGLFSARVYVSTATFIPQGAEAGAAPGLALAASQLGIRMPSSAASAWGPPLYVKLIRSQSLLEPIALDTVVVAEERDRRVALMDLLKIRAGSKTKRIDLAVKSLQRLVTASEDKRLGAVGLSVTSKWPSVSLAIADKLLLGLNQFNLEKRKSQATAERLFVEGQAGEAERTLRESEDQLQIFLQRNRSFTSSPDLEFQRDRLQRVVALRQQVYTSLVQNREEARIREVRDTPVITVLEAPRLPVVGEARHSIGKGMMGALTGGILGVLLLFIVEGVVGAKTHSSKEAREFFQLVAEATPGFLKRGAIPHPDK